MLLTRAINNGLDLVPAHSDEAAALRAEMQDVSSRVGFDKLGTATTLLWEFDAAFGAGDLPALRRVSAEGSQWWNRNGAERELGHRGAGRLTPSRRAGSPTPPEALRRASPPCCPGDKRQHYLRLDIALAAARGDRDGGRRTVRGAASPSPPLHDTASTLEQRRRCSSRTC